MRKMHVLSKLDQLAPLFVLFVVSGIVYLPLVTKFGYFNDDWYLMYAAGAKGASVFQDIFGIDRPGRALVMEPVYWLFGQNPLYYNLSAYFFRFLGGASFYWFLDMLWPKHRFAIANMALLFLIYPGFLSLPNAIDYQSHIVGLAAAILSIACSVKATLIKKNSSKFMFFSLSIVLGWFYLWQMEWYIGFEVLRWATIFMLMRRIKAGTLLQYAWRVVCQAYPLLTVPFLFLLWRIVLFKPERGATDLGLQLGQIIQSPLTTTLRGLITLFGDSLDVVVMAWGQPFSLLLNWVWSRDQLLWGFGLSLVSVTITILLLRKLGTQVESEKSKWLSEAFWLGTVGVTGGILPVVLVNRYVDFEFFSRYTLVSSASGVIVLGALVFSLENLYIRKVILASLIFIASLTHYANSQKAVQLSGAMRDFWWQVSWRVPQLERNTTLVANYAVGATEEDYFVWGPANLIYYPEGTRDEYVQPGVYAALLNQNTVIKTLLNEGQEYDNRRTIRTYKNYRKLLVLTQPTGNSCVHVINGQQPEYSYHENPLIRILGPHSNLEFVLVDSPVILPPQVVFGPEPEHDWCFYYQKASLARQRNDWDEVSRLGSQVASLGLGPKDLIEWMPFIQAYAIREEVSRLSELAESIDPDPYSTQQACQVLGEIQGLSEPTTQAVRLLYCDKKVK